MSHNRLEMRGLTEFRDALRRLPQELADEATAIIRVQAQEAARQIQQAYPTGPTGNLKAGVSVEINSSQFTASALVRSRAPHAHLWEFGTRKRQNNSGANRGAMPKPTGQTFISVMIRRRRAMTEALIALLRRAGLEVRT